MINAFKERDDKMNTMLKIKSKSILTGRNMRASSILLFAITASILMGLAPSFIKLIPYYGRWALWIKLAVSVAVILISAAALYPLRTGSEAWFFRGASGREPSATQIVFWYKPSKIAKSVEMRFSLLARKLIWAFVFLAPGVSIIGGALYMTATEGISANLLISSLAGGGMTISAGLAFYALMVQKYFIAYAVLARDPGKTVGEAIKKSIEAMDGCCAKTLLFRLSFAPWLLPCLAVFPILYVWPYYRQSCSCLKYEIYRNHSLSEAEKDKNTEQADAAETYTAETDTIETDTIETDGEQLQTT